MGWVSIVFIGYNKAHKVFAVVTTSVKSSGHEHRYYSVRKLTIVHNKYNTMIIIIYQTLLYSLVDNISSSVRYYNLNCLQV